MDTDTLCAKSREAMSLTTGERDLAVKFVGMTVFE